MRQGENLSPIFFSLFLNDLNDFFYHIPLIVFPIQIHIKSRMIGVWTKILCEPVHVISNNVAF